MSIYFNNLTLTIKFAATAAALCLSLLVTANETNISPVDTRKWFHQTQLPNGRAWFSGELQHYTDRIANAYISNGTLKIVAKKEAFTDQGKTKQYTSARLNSKFAFKYGRVEVRAQVPADTGTWPAIWTLGKNIKEPGAYWQTEGYGTTSWPGCGEIDIMEHWGSRPNFVQSAMHTLSSSGDTLNRGGQTIATATTGFHIYSMEWSAKSIGFSVDDVLHYQYKPRNRNSRTWPFDKEQYLILNLAIESDIHSSFSSSQLEIDYIRVYAKDASLGDKPIWSDEFDQSI